MLGHRCRYDRETLQTELTEAGFVVETLLQFNRLGRPGWWLNGKVLKKRHFDRVQLKIFNWLVPLLRRVDHRIPADGLGLIAVARRPDDPVTDRHEPDRYGAHQADPRVLQP